MRTEITRTELKWICEALGEMISDCEYAMQSDKFSPLEKSMSYRMHGNYSSIKDRLMKTYEEEKRTIFITL